MADIAEELDGLAWKAQGEGDKNLAATLHFLSAIKGEGRDDLMGEVARFCQARSGKAVDESELSEEERAARATGAEA